MATASIASYGTLSLAIAGLVLGIVLVSKPKAHDAPVLYSNLQLIKSGQKEVYDQVTSCPTADDANAKSSGTNGCFMYVPLSDAFTATANYALLKFACTVASEGAGFRLASFGNTNTASKDTPEGNKVFFRVQLVEVDADGNPLPYDAPQIDLFSGLKVLYKSAPGLDMNVRDRKSGNTLRSGEQFCNDNDSRFQLTKGKRYRVYARLGLATDAKHLSLEWPMGVLAELDSFSAAPPTDNVFLDTTTRPFAPMWVTEFHGRVNF
jgi:hypothetical protein